MNFLRTRRALLTCAVFSAAALAPLAHAQQVLRVTTIPEEAATEQIRKFTPLASYLEKALGMKVEFTPVNDYPAAVEALVNKKVDVVWFGGFTHVQANIRSGGKIVPLAQREEDTKFQSVFIAKTASGTKTLADMKGSQRHGRRGSAGLVCSPLHSPTGACSARCMARSWKAMNPTRPRRCCAMAARWRSASPAEAVSASRWKTQ